MKQNDTGPTENEIKDRVIEYKYNEGMLLDEIKRYVDATYSEHYSRNRFQTTEFTIDCGHGIGFTIGNILKYAQRYGRKGSSADWRKDLLKVIHYAIMALYVHDLETEVTEEKEEEAYTKEREHMNRLIAEINGTEPCLNRKK